MKRIVTILAIAVLFSANLKPIQAQDTNRWDARLGVGFFGLQDIVPILAVTLGEYEDEGINTLSEIVPIATPSLDMSYECTKHISVGAQITLGFANEKYKYNRTNKIGNTSIIYPTIMANLKANYLKKNNFSMYLLLGLGISNYFVIDNNPTYSSIGVNYFAIPMFNIYPLCFSTNRDNGFYIEVGYGSKGYLNLGWEIKL
jgi:hypothetical protein